MIPLSHTMETRGGWIWVLDPAGRRVERHRDPAVAERAALRLSGICLHCGRPISVCRIENPRDPDLGADYDDSEEETA